MTSPLRRILLIAALIGRSASAEGDATTDWAALSQSLDAKEVETRLQAVRQAAAIADARATELLITALRNPSRNVREAASAALTERPGPHAMEPLLVAVADTDTTVRRVSVRALAAFDDPRVTAALVDRMLNDPDGNVRAPAADALRQRQGPGVVDALCRAMLDRDDSVRLAALASLHERQDPASMDAALLAVGDTHEIVRAGARELALVLAGPATATNVVRALAVPNLPVKRFAAELLGRMREPLALWHLVEILRTETDGNVRGAAAMALGQIGDARAVPALIDLLETRDLGLRETARQALVQLTGLDYGTNAARWKSRSARSDWRGRLHASPFAMTLVKSVLAWLGVAVAARAQRFWAGAAWYGAALLVLNAVLQIAPPAWYEQAVYGGLLALVYYWAIDRLEGESLWIAVVALGAPILGLCFT
jgi:HEAT repeat protein